MNRGVLARLSTDFVLGSRDPEVALAADRADAVVHQSIMLVDDFRRFPSRGTLDLSNQVFGWLAFKGRDAPIMDIESLPLRQSIGRAKNQDDRFSKAHKRMSLGRFGGFDQLSDFDRMIPDPFHSQHLGDLERHIALRVRHRCAKRHRLRRSGDGPRTCEE